jgi:uncharacterized protein (DUF1501 family)
VAGGLPISGHSPGGKSRWTFPAIPFGRAAQLGLNCNNLTRGGYSVASVDVGGWDTREGQQGQFQNKVQRLSSALGAFWNGIAAYQPRVTVVAFSEFGRRLRANKSGGTDHGRGGVMIVMGVA